jgi:hypothetical protein
LKERFSEQYAARNGVYRRRYNHELDIEFENPNALKFRRPEDLPQKAQTQWKEKSRKTEIKMGGWGEQR